MARKSEQIAILECTKPDAKFWFALEVSCLLTYRCSLDCCCIFYLPGSILHTKPFIDTLPPLDDNFIKNVCNVFVFVQPWRTIHQLNVGFHIQPQGQMWSYQSRCKESGSFVLHPAQTVTTPHRSYPTEVWVQDTSWCSPRWGHATPLGVVRSWSNWRVHRHLKLKKVVNLQLWNFLRISNNIGID